MSISAKKREEYDQIYLSHIGSNVEIIDSKNKNQIGISGMLVHETAKTLILEVEGELKRFLKSSVELKIDKNGKALKMDGRSLFYTLKSRIKKLKWWELFSVQILK